MVEPFPVFFVLLLIEFGTAELQLKIVNFAQSAQCHVSWCQEVTPWYKITIWSILVIVGPKCTLAASHAVPWCVTVNMPKGQTDGRQTVT